MHPDSFGSRTRRTVGGKSFEIFRLEALSTRRVGKVSRLPFSIKILLENLLRHEDGVTATADDIRALANWSPSAPPDREIAFRPARVLLQDFTGVPALVDLAAMRDAAKRMGGDPRKSTRRCRRDWGMTPPVRGTRFVRAGASPATGRRRTGGKGAGAPFCGGGRGRSATSSSRKRARAGSPAS